MEGKLLMLTVFVYSSYILQSTVILLLSKSLWTRAKGTGNLLDAILVNALLFPLTHPQQDFTMFHYFLTHSTVCLGTV